jgi:hypothetical protein
MNLRRVLSLILAAAVLTFVFVERKPLIELWTAMYPSDPIHKMALQICYDDDHQFNRMSTKQRHDCYAKWEPILYYMASQGKLPKRIGE